MFLSILKKDIKRKKTMNLIIFLFIVLSVMFVASGLNNIVTTVGGTEYYLDLAGVGDYVILNLGDDREIADVLTATPAVMGWKSEEVFYGSQSDLSAGGRKIVTNKTMLYQSLTETATCFFDVNNQKITQVAPGEVFLTGPILEMNDLSPEDYLDLTLGSSQLHLKIAGFAKDALLGSEFMGNHRLLLSEEDYATLAGDESLAPYRGAIFHVETDDLSAVESAISSASGILFKGSRATIQMCYVMDLIVAFVVLALSICLMIVSFVALRFTIAFTISEDYREIGVMKAIGIPDIKIRGLYIVKYLALSGAASIAGFIGSIPFGKMLMQSVSKNMVLGNNGGLLFNLLGAVLVVLATLLFAFGCTGRIKKASPVDAIRSGQTGERYKKKALLRLGHHRGSTVWYLACNDILSSPKRFLTVIITFFLCSVFVLGVVITTCTMDSDELITTICLKSDLYLNDVSKMMKMMGADDVRLEDALDELTAQITEAGMPCRLSQELFYMYRVTADGKDFQVNAFQGINTRAEEYAYLSGSAPQSRNEIAVTPVIAALMGVDIGDSVIIHFGSEDLNCIITGTFETLNQLGEALRLHEDAPTDSRYVTGGHAFQIDFTDAPSEDEILLRQQKLREMFDTEDVFTAREYCVECIETVDTMRAVQYLLMTITVIVVILVTVLLESSFITDEKSQIALLKAVGYRDRDIIAWHVLRFGIVGVLVELAAVVLSKPVTALWCSPIFGMMGASHIRFRVDPLQVCLLYPGIILLTTVGAAWLTAGLTRRIHCRDTASIE